MLRTVVLALALTILADSVAAAALPKVLTEHERRPFEVRPASISYTGDGTGFLGGSDGTGPRHPGHLRWTSYTRRAGWARGIDWLDDCDPSCAEGRFSAVPVRVHVFRPRHGRFTRITLRYRYRGHHVLDRRGIRYFPPDEGLPGYWAYYLISYGR